MDEYDNMILELQNERLVTYLNSKRQNYNVSNIWFVWFCMFHLIAILSVLS